MHVQTRYQGEADAVYNAGLGVGQIFGPERTVVCYLVAMTLEYPTEYYWQAGSIAGMVAFRLLSLASIVYPLYLLFRYRPRLDWYRVYFVWTFLYALGLTLFYLCVGEGRNVSNLGIYFAMLSALCVSAIRIDVLHRALVPVAALGCIVLVYLFGWSQIDLAVALRRGYTWTQVFYYAGVYWAMIPMVIASFVRDRYVSLGVAYWMCSVMVNLLFLKRFILVDSVLLIGVLLLIAYQRRGKKWLTISRACIYGGLILLLSVALFGRILGPLFIASLSRVQSVSDMGSIDRLVESRTYLEGTCIWSLVVGKGFLGTHSGLGVESDALHVGWTNFLLKGGIPLVLLVLLPYGRLVSLLPMAAWLPTKVQFSVYMMLVYAVRLLYTNMHSFAPEMLVFFYCLFSVMAYGKKTGAYSRRSGMEVADASSHSSG